MQALAASSVILSGDFMGLRPATLHENGLRVPEGGRLGKAGRSALQVIVSSDGVELAAFCDDSNPQRRIGPRRIKVPLVVARGQREGRMPASVTDQQCI